MKNQFDVQDAKLQGQCKQSRKLANNTYLQRRDKNIAVLYHSTDVVIYTPNGNTILNSGGWHTSTTKERINIGLQGTGYRLIQNNSIWYLTNYSSYPDYKTLIQNGYKFKDGITITHTGKVTNYDKTDSSKNDKLKARIKVYAKLCADAVPLDMPNNGDCWDCLFQNKDGKTLGDLTNNEHLLSHMREKYIVPSLVANALKEKYNAPMAFWQAFKDTGWTDDKRDFGKQAVKKAVYRYIASRLGFAV
jgi:hypothetical protein